VSEVGSQVTVLALPLVALVTMHASAFEVGLLSAAVTAAYLVVALPAGAIVERRAKRRLMIWCDLGRLALIGSIPLAAAAGLLTLAQLYVVALVSSAVSVFFSVAYMAYVPTLLTRDQLMDGNGKLGTTQSVAQIAGPGLDAALVALFGAAMAMVADAVSYLLPAGLLLAIRTREASPLLSTRQPRFRSQIRDGLAYVRHEPILLKGVLWSGSATSSSSWSSRWAPCSWCGTCT
jgi:MFS family permease